MGPEPWQYLTIIAGLVAAIYSGMLFEQRRSAKNIHQLRHVVQKIIITLAIHGIAVKTDEDKDE